MTIVVFARNDPLLRLHDGGSLSQKTSRQAPSIDMLQKSPLAQGHAASDYAVATPTCAQRTHEQESNASIGKAPWRSKGVTLETHAYRAADGSAMRTSAYRPIKHNEPVDLSISWNHLVRYRVHLIGSKLRVGLTISADIEYATIFTLLGTQQRLHTHWCE